MIRCQLIHKLYFRFLLTVETDPAEILSGQAWYNLRLTLWRGSFVGQQAARFRPPVLCKKYILLSCLGPVFWGFANQVIGKCETENIFWCHKAVFQSSLKWIFTNNRNQIFSQTFLRFPPAVCKLSRLESEAVTLPEKEIYFK